MGGEVYTSLQRLKRAARPTWREERAMSAIGEFDEMTRTERVRAAVRGEEVDRIPVAFWHHFRPEGSGRRQAELTLGFFDEQFDLDICKIMPDIPYPFPRKSITDA